MGAFIALKFIAVLITAAVLVQDWRTVLVGLTVPRIPLGTLPWMLGVLGGVGGTVTLLSYGYWIREKGRSGEDGQRICRIDLGVCYLLTALFGVSMINAVLILTVLLFAYVGYLQLTGQMISTGG